MIYLQQFDFKIEHKASKKMSHVNYLSKLPVEQQVLYEPENSEEETFVG